ncbi:hypothetical protein [Arundinibacter roseus]|nr:hypothetical protein [Arundinibacter roseus]
MVDVLFGLAETVPLSGDDLFIGYPVTGVKCGLLAVALRQQ